MNTIFKKLSYLVNLIIFYFFNIFVSGQNYNPTLNWSPLDEIYLRYLFREQLKHFREQLKHVFALNINTVRNIYIHEAIMNVN